MTQSRNGPPIEVEGRAPHHRDRPSTSKFGSHATAYNRTTELTAPSAETPGTTNSRQVSWWETHQFIEALIAQANTGPLPPAGTPAWSVLADGDPRKLLALAVAGEHHVLRVETAQTAMAKASQAVSAAADWTRIGRRNRDHEDFHRQRPWLRRKASRC
ncbi:DUF2742 domain-containing protein [Mycobacterium avium]|uniref:DUF2742 domain-containing protein n=1 Tax=Mycobacterium avium TaxID=1764 RepID=UPI000CE41C2B|nr:DUF2742 domain-containing protein [Mycobacterium avium]